MTTCRNCYATILFVRLDTGKPIPVDPISYPDKGNVAAKRVGGTLVGYVISRDKPLLDDHQRYMPHFSSCKPDEPRVAASERTPNLFEESSER